MMSRETNDKNIGKLPLVVRIERNMEMAPIGSLAAIHAQGNVNIWIDAK